MFLPLYIMIGNVLFLICFVIIFNMKREFRDVKKEMNREYLHILGNIKNLKTSIEKSLDNKHDEIEKVGQNYINQINQIKEVKKNG